MKHLVYFVVVGCIFGLYYSIWGNEMFDLYNIDKGKDVNKSKNLKIMPLSLKIERFWHRFTGVFLGWMFMWVLLDLRLNIFQLVLILKIWVLQIFFSLFLAT